MGEVESRVEAGLQRHLCRSLSSFPTISLYVYFPASTPHRSSIRGMGLSTKPASASSTSIFMPSLIPYFFLSGAGIVTCPFLVTVVVSNTYILVGHEHVRIT